MKDQNRMRVLRVSLLALLLCGGHAMGANLTKNVTVVGRKTCGFWTTTKNSNDKVGTVILQNWVMGYLSGIAMTKGSNFLSRIDGESLFLWIDQYCEKNPISNIVDASEEIAKELQKK